MGGGIAMAFANAGFPVTLVDASAEALDRGVQRIASLYGESVKRGKLSQREADACLARIMPATDLAVLASSDLVIEAVYEDLALKSRLAAQLAAVVAPYTVIASNTSSLDVNLIADASGVPDRFVGMHFFSPAHIMKLVEVVRGAKSAPGAVETVVDLARAIRKIPVVCGVGFGFIGNRIAEPYLREAEALVLEGATPAQVDAVAQSPEWLGMAMGPCRMMDLAGLDIGASIIAERAAATNLLDDASYRAVTRALTAQGHLGQKTGRGYYRYENRQPIEASETVTLAEQLAEEHGVVRRESISEEEIFQRLIYPMINEGYEVLRGGIAESSADIDTVFIAGYGFPPTRGGPMAMAAIIGAGELRSKFEAFGKQRGNPYGYWTVSPLLLQ